MFAFLESSFSATAHLRSTLASVMGIVFALHSVATPNPLASGLFFPLLTPVFQKIRLNEGISMSGATDVDFLPHFPGFCTSPSKRIQRQLRERSQSDGVVGSSSPRYCRDQTAIVRYVPRFGTWYTLNLRKI